jgi:hypothetical protein
MAEVVATRSGGGCAGGCLKGLLMLSLLLMALWALGLGGLWYLGHSLPPVAPPGSGTPGAVATEAEAAEAEPAPIGTHLVLVRLVCLDVGGDYDPASFEEMRVAVTVDGAPLLSHSDDQCNWPDRALKTYEVYGPYSEVPGVPRPLKLAFTIGEDDGGELERVTDGALELDAGALELGQAVQVVVPGRTIRYALLTASNTVGRLFGNDTGGGVGEQITIEGAEVVLEVARIPRKGADDESRRVLRDVVGFAATGQGASTPEEARVSYARTHEAQAGLEVLRRESLHWDLQRAAPVLLAQVEELLRAEGSLAACRSASLTAPLAAVEGALEALSGEAEASRLAKAACEATRAGSYDVAYGAARDAMSALEASSNAGVRHSPEVLQARGALHDLREAADDLVVRKRAVATAWATLQATVTRELAPPDR